MREIRNSVIIIQTNVPTILLELPLFAQIK